MTKLVTVLLVEYRRADAQLVQHALHAFSGVSFQIEVRSSLLDALAALAGLKPDIIITDLDLPDSVGLPTFEQLHQNAPTTPALILTARTDPALGVQAMAAGAQDYLVKGEFESHSLARLVLQAIARQKLRLVTARQLDKVEASLTRLRNLVDVNLDGIVIVNHQGQIIFSNRRAEELCGKPANAFTEQVLGRPLIDEHGSVVDFADAQGRQHSLFMRTQRTVWDGEDACLMLLRQTSQTGVASSANAG